MPVFRIRLATIVAFVCFAISTISSAQTVERVEGVIPRVDAQITLDGRADEEFWDQALVVDLPIEFSPGVNIPADVETECRLAYTDRSLYVLFLAKDPDPKKIRARYDDRDRARRDDAVGIVVDAFNDERRGFVFAANPLGVQIDASVNDVGGGQINGFFSRSGAPGEDSSWDAIWNSRGRLTDDGFVVEMEIPFHQLRFPSDEGPQTWGFSAFRVRPRAVQHKYGSRPLDPDRACYFCQVGKIEGIDGITPGRNLEVVPTLTFGRFDEAPNFPAGPIENGSFEEDLGLSLRWGVTPNLSLNAAVNPDFSQVEADVGQLDINRRFTLFFTEKRPFFLEGRDFFQTPYNAIFTRSISRPDAAVKLTGKTGKNALGILVAQDEVTNVILPSNQGSSAESLLASDGLDEDNLSAAFRFRRDVGSGSILGVLGTVRSGDGYSNLLGGLDGLLRLGSSDRIRFQWLTTTTEYPQVFADRVGTAADVDGSALRVNYDHRSKHWGWFAGYNDIDSGFRADLGFMPRVDVNTISGGVDRTFFGDLSETWFNRITLGTSAFRTEDQSGQQTNEFFDFTASYRGPWQSIVRISAFAGEEFFEGQQFSRDGVSFFYNMRPNATFTHSFEFVTEDAIDFSGARQGRQLLIEPEFTLNLGRHFFCQFEHTWRRFEVADAELFTANLTQGRLIYQFNTRLFARAILQLVDIERDEVLFGSSEPIDTRTLFGQYLLSYKINPQTVLFAGYSENLGADEITTLDRRNRAFFAKFGYAWLP